MKAQSASILIGMIVSVFLFGCKKDEGPMEAARDTAAPSVSIAYPSSGQTVSSMVTVIANASDNVGVTAVGLRIDGSELFRKTSPPWELSWNTENKPDGAYRISVTAYDAAGNSTTSNAVNVNVQNPFVLTLTNGVFTDITVSVSGQSSRGIAAYSYATFTYASNPGTIAIHGTTAAMAGSNQLGLRLNWDETKTVTGYSSADFSLDVDNTIFFIYLKNLSSNQYNWLYVNYGTSYQRIANAGLPPGPSGDLFYLMGYYEAIHGTTIRAYRTQNANTWVLWQEGGSSGGFTLPFTKNQSATLLIPTNGEPLIDPGVAGEDGSAAKVVQSEHQKVINKHILAPWSRSESIVGHPSPGQNDAPWNSSHGLPLTDHVPKTRQIRNTIEIQGGR